MFSNPFHILKAPRDESCDVNITYQFFFIKSQPCYGSMAILNRKSEPYETITRVYKEQKHPLDIIDAHDQF